MFKYDYKFKRQLLVGYQYMFEFENGYGASVVKHDKSIGWELTVVKIVDGNYRMVFDTPITQGVKVDLSLEDINNVLEAINSLD